MLKHSFVDRRWLLAALLLVAGLAVATLADARERRDRHDRPAAPARHADFSTSRAAMLRALRRGRPDLTTTVAKRLRRRSRVSFRALGPTRAKAVGRDAFAEVFAGPVYHGLDLLPNERLERYEGDYGARIDLGGNERAIASSMIPLRTRDRTGRKVAVDLRLRARGGRFVADAPLVDLVVGDDASSGFAFPDSELAVRRVGARASAGRLIDGRAFYPNVALDSDELVLPTPAGAETLTVLRSPSSPTRHAYELELPAGARLELKPGPGGLPDGAQVVLDDRRIMAIPAPVAWDADGLPVPVDFRVEGSRLVLDAKHRGGDFRYPLLLDPDWRVTEDYSGWPNTWGWAPYSTNGNYGFGTSNWNFSFGTRSGLTVSAAPGNYMSDSSWGQWTYKPPGDSFIYRTEFQFVSYEFLFHCVNRGIWSPRANGWDRNPGYSGFDRQCGTLNNNYLTWCVDDGSCNVDFGDDDNQVIFGLQAANFTPGQWVYYNNWAGAVMQNAIVYERDRYDPWMTAFSHDSPSGWTDGAPVHASVSADDRGLGISDFALIGPNPQTKVRCDGTRWQRCDNPRGWGTSFTIDPPEGRSSWWIAAHDANNRGAATSTFETKADKSAPREVGQSGQLAADGQWVKSGTYSLTATANDDQSGVKQLDLLVGSGSVSTHPQQSDCGATGAQCPNPRTGALKWDTSPSTVAEGAHTLQVRATDAVGRAASGTPWKVNVDKTKPTIDAVTGLLATAGAWIDDGPQTIHVEAGDARSGVERVQLLVDETVVDTATTSAGGCTSAFCANLKWDNPDAADGPHSVGVRVIDRAGNAAGDDRRWTVKRDSVDPLLNANGSLVGRAGETATLGSYELDLDASDGDATTAESGVSRIRLYVDGTEKAGFGPQSCPNGSCAGQLTYDFDAAGFGPGTYEVLAVVTDIAGNEDRQAFDVTVDPLPPQTADVLDVGQAGVASTSVGGTSVDAHGGNSVASLGDVNGDAIPDYAVGVPAGDPSPPVSPGTPGVVRTNAGRVFVVYGRGAGGQVNLADVAAGNGGYVIDGDVANDYTGTAVANAGDVNGDGHSDLLIGAPGTDGSAVGLALRSRVYVVFGGDNSYLDLRNLGSRGFVIAGPPPTASTAGASARRFGSVLSSVAGEPYGAAADVNGDDKDDIVIGSSEETRAAAGSGTAYVVYGKATTDPVDAVTLAPAAGFRLDGGGINHRAGYAAAAVGDVDNDGFADVAVIAPGRNAAGRTNAGTAYLVYGAASNGNGQLDQLGSRGWALEGADGDALGSSVAAVGDTSGGEFDDIAIGGRRTVVAYGNEERIAPTRSGVGAAIPGVGYVIEAPAEYGGAQVAGGADLDGDTLPDVALGFPALNQGRGAAFLVYSPIERPRNLNLAQLPGELGTRVDGAQAGDAFGASVQLLETDEDTPRASALVGAPGTSAAVGSPRTSGTTYEVPASQTKRSTLVRRRRPNPCWKVRARSYAWPPPVDRDPRQVTCRRTATGRLDARELETRRGAFADRLAVSGQVPLYDSFGQKIASLENAGKRGSFKVYDAQGTLRGTTQKPPRAERGSFGSWRLVLNGDQCNGTRPSAAGKSSTSTRTLVVLRQAVFRDLDYPTASYPSAEKIASEAEIAFSPENDLNRAKTVNLGVRGFIRKDALPVLEYYEDRGGAAAQAEDMWKYSSCGRKASNRRAPTTATRGLRIGAWATNINLSRSSVSDLYQGGNTIGPRSRAVQTSNGTVYKPASGCRPHFDGNAERSCGGLYAYYFRPFWGAADTGGSTVVALTASTTGVGGGGTVRGLIKVDGSEATAYGKDKLFIEKDRIQYLDHNVPCGNRERTRWYFGRATLPSYSFYGWYPEPYYLIPDAEKPAAPATSRACPAPGSEENDPAPGSPR